MKKEIFKKLARKIRITGYSNAIDEARSADMRRALIIYNSHRHDLGLMRRFGTERIMEDGSVVSS